MTSKRGFDGRFLKVDVLDVELEDGRRTVREIVSHPGAAAVLPRLPDGRFVLVRQFRKPVERELLEIMAGTLEPDEDPETCARRELQEETGYRASSLHRLGEIVPAPGYTSERLFLFYAVLDPDPSPLEGDEDENIEVVYASAEEIEAWIACGEIIDAKTIAAWYTYRMK